MAASAIIVTHRKSDANSSIFKGCSMHNMHIRVFSVTCSGIISFGATEHCSVPKDIGKKIA